METEETDKMPKEDLDWEGFLKRMGLKKAETARLIGAAPAMMTDWIGGKNQPSWKYLKRLGMAGMTAQEMFGEEAGNALVRNSIDVKAGSQESALDLDTTIRREVFKILGEINIPVKIKELPEGNTFLDKQIHENSTSGNK